MVSLKDRVAPFKSITFSDGAAATFIWLLNCFNTSDCPADLYIQRPKNSVNFILCLFCSCGNCGRGTAAVSSSCSYILVSQRFRPFTRQYIRLRRLEMQHKFSIRCLGIAPKLMLQDCRSLVKIFRYYDTLGKEYQA